MQNIIEKHKVLLNIADRQNTAEQSFMLLHKYLCFQNVCQNIKNNDFFFKNAEKNAMFCC